MKNLKGTFILLLAAFIWGTAFVAQTSAGDNIGAFTFNACRNIIGALFLFIVIAILDMRDMIIQVRIITIYIRRTTLLIRKII
jgi:drug/metabolite transporter (DMT)-like permease